MKKLSSIIIYILFLSTLHGQGFIKAEYFFDSDPGINNGTTILVGTTSDTANFTATVSTSSLSAGFHILGLRVLHNDGVWSLFETRKFYISSPIGGNTPDIVAAEYFIDTDPGAGNGTAISVGTSGATVNFTATIPTMLPVGFHFLAIRTKDANGKWGFFETRRFYISQPAAPNMPVITEAEYFFDLDPGPGNANPLPVPTPGDLVNLMAGLSVPCLSAGQHYLSIRVKDQSNHWSLFGYDTLTVTSGVSASTVTPSGPVTMCVSDSVILSADSIPGISYQWLLNGNDISGANSFTYTVHIAGNYSLKTTCNGSFIVSNVVIVNTQQLLTFYFDADGDTYGDLENTTQACIAPVGFVSDNTDCDDANNAIYPGAVEICNGVDDDCDGLLDDADPSISGQSTWYADADGDGFGNAASSTLACNQPSGFISNDEDCNDGNSAINPNATELCNGMDDDCDGLTDDADPSINGQSTWYQDSDNDGYGKGLISVVSCDEPSGYVSQSGDCNDTDALINPGISEVCNDIDDDCDGLMDDADPSISGQTTWYQDSDNDGYGKVSISTVSCDQPSGYVSQSGDCNDTDALVNPGVTEACNNIDDDCDGLMDDADPGIVDQLVWYQDGDSDGFGNQGISMYACYQPIGYIGNADDCNDADPNVNPGMTEICNGIDDNCNSTTDEGFIYSVATTSVSSYEGNTFCHGESTTLSLTGGTLGSGAAWKWYKGGCGTGAIIGTGTSIVVSPSAGVHEYFVRAEGLCNATQCASIQISVNSSPAFTLCPSDIDADNASSACSAAVNYSVTANGSPSPTLAYVFSGATTGSGSGTGSGASFNKGTTTVTITALNECGSAECTFDVTVHDAESPVLTGCPGPIVAEVETGQWGAHVTWNAPTAADNCAMSSLTSTFAPGDFFNVGTTAVEYSALDMEGNMTSCSFTVSVQQPDILGDVNISIFADDIQFSNSNPDPGAFIIVSATVNNNSNVPATSFTCRLENQYTNETYTDVTVPELEANESIIVSWTIQTPPDPAFVPMKVTIDFSDALDESNELDNQAIRPFINGEFETEGLIEVSVNAIPTSTAGSAISICGSAHYDETAIELLDPDVSGAQVTIYIEETGQVLYGVTNANGDFCVTYFTSNTPGTYHFTAEVTDFTITGEASGTFQISTPVCSKDLSLSLELFGDFLCGSRYHIVQGAPLTGIVNVRNDCQAVSIPTTLFIALPGGTPVPGPFLIPALAPGEQYEVLLPAMTFNSIGTTFINATVDVYNELAENNESNNSTSRTINIHPPLPDISPRSGSISSTFQCTQEAVSFRIENEGGIPSGAFNTLLEVYHGNTLEATFTQMVNSIPALCSANITFAFSPASSGLYTFHFYCDTMPQVVSELSASNNSLSFSQFFLECGNDLVVHGCGSIDVKPTDPVSPGTITLFASIANEGKLAVTTSFVVNFDIAGTVYPVTVNQSIPVQGTVQVSVTVPAPPYGNNDLLVTADANNDVVEMQEGNNSATDKICWDFSLSNVTCDGEKEIQPSHYICNPLILKTQVSNQGLFEASHLGIKFEVSGPGLPPGWTNLGQVNTFMDRTCGCSLRVRLPNTFFFPQTGTYSIRMKADVNNQYTECNEGNNELILTVQVVENADYAIYSEYIAPSELNPGVNEPITIDVTYKNEGCSGLTPVELHVQTDNVSFDSVQANSLAANAFNTYELPDPWSSALPGLHIISAMIDHDGVLAESNELNNVATRSVIVGGAPNVDLFDLVASNMSPLSGETIILTGSMTNEGEISADGVLQFFYVNDQHEEVLIEQRNIFITGNETLSVDIPWFVTQPGAKIVARVSQVVPLEFDFTDNEKQLQLNNLSVSIATTDVACNGLALGILEATIAGGKTPYTLQWSNGYTVDSINVPAGEYSLLVTDANGLTAFVTATVAALAIPVTWYLDADQDGYGDDAVSQLSCMNPSGYVLNNDDCDDGDAYVNPSATELCDDIDNECDGMTDDSDEDVTGQSTYYLDADGDGFGNSAVTVTACFQPANYTGTGTDCDDTDGANSPGGTEVLDGADNDCDGDADEGLNTISADAGDCKVVYQGYAPAECTVLTVNVTGGVEPYTYAWNNGANTPSTIVCPEETTIFTVIVSDLNGSTTQEAVTVQVIDISCANNKANVCHIPPGNPANAHTICISVNAVATHLEGHGDYLGTCGAQDPCTGENQSLISPPGAIDHQHESHEHKETKGDDPSGKEGSAGDMYSGNTDLQVYPNPTNGMFFVKLPGTHEDLGILSVFTSQGKRLQSKQVSGDQQLVLDLSSQPNGMYLIVVNFGTGQWQKIIGNIE